MQLMPLHPVSLGVLAALAMLGKFSRANAPRIGNVFFAAALKKFRLERISSFLFFSSFII
jgi:hypothetical protein